MTPPEARIAPPAQEPRVLVRFLGKYRGPTGGTHNADEIAGLREGLARRLIEAGVAEEIPAQEPEALPEDGDPEPNRVADETSSGPGIAPEPTGTLRFAEDEARAEEADSEPGVTASSAPEVVTSSAPEGARCLSCGGPVPEKSRRSGGAKMFCSTLCRVRAWREKGKA